MEEDVVFLNEDSQDSVKVIDDTSEVQSLNFDDLLILPGKPREGSSSGLKHVEEKPLSPKKYAKTQPTSPMKDGKTQNKSLTKGDHESQASAGSPSAKMVASEIPAPPTSLDQTKPVKSGLVRVNPVHEKVIAGAKFKTIVKPFILSHPERNVATLKTSSIKKPAATSSVENPAKTPPMSKSLSSLPFSQPEPTTSPPSLTSSVLNPAPSGVNSVQTNVNPSQTAVNPVPNTINPVPKEVNSSPTGVNPIAASSVVNQPSDGPVLPQSPAGLMLAHTPGSTSNVITLVLPHNLISPANSKLVIRLPVLPSGQMVQGTLAPSSQDYSTNQFTPSDDAIDLGGDSRGSSPCILENHSEVSLL